MYFNKLMKVITIRDDVYYKLRRLKGERSFSQLLQELAENYEKGQEVNRALAVAIMDRIRKKIPGKKAEEIIREDRDAR